MSKISRADIKEFKSTINGKKKRTMLIIGTILLLVGCFASGFVNGYCEGELLTQKYSIISFSCLLVSILGTYLIGVYYGALEQYALSKKEVK